LNDEWAHIASKYCDEENGRDPGLEDELAFIAAELMFP